MKIDNSKNISMLKLNSFSAVNLKSLLIVRVCAEASEVFASPNTELLVSVFL